MIAAARFRSVRFALPFLLAAAACGAGGARTLEAQQSFVETLLLAPDPGEVVPQNDVLVAVSFIDPGGRIDPASIRLSVGGVDVTAQANISAEVVTWRPVFGLQLGDQRVTLTMRDRNGAPLAPASWNFRVIAPRENAPTPLPAGTAQAPLSGSFWSRTQGNVIFENRTNSVSGDGAASRRDEAFLPQLWVNAAGPLVGGIRYSARFHLSGYESSTTQPINRYRLNLRSENVQLALGDVNPELHPLILLGRRVRGVQADLRAGFFGISSIAGETRRAVPGLLDSLDPTRVARQGSFSRDLFAVRPSFGRGDLFQVGVTFLRVKDDVGSIPTLRTQASTENGSTQSANPLPKDNVAVGTDFSLRLLQGQILFQYENAISLLANDISGGPLGKASLDSLLEEMGEEPLGIDPEEWEKFFTINGSLIPLDPTGFTNVAHQVRSTIRAGGHYISGQYYSIGGAYYSLGHPSLQRDRAGFRITDSFALMANALVASVGLDRDRDNLNDVKEATTSSNGVSADLRWQRSPDEIGFSANVRLGTRSNDLTSGSTGAIDETNRTVALGVVVPVRLFDGVRTRLNLNGSIMTRDDAANALAGSRNLYFLAGLQGETLDRRTDFSLLYGLNRAELTGYENATTDFHRASARGRYQFDARWAGIAEGVLTLARSPEEAQEFGLRYDRKEFTLGGEYAWTASSYVTFQAGVVSYQDERFPGRNTREFLTRLRVTQPF